MPGFFYRSQLKQADVDTKIETAKALLNKLEGKDLSNFMARLQTRISEFLNELAKPENDATEKLLILEQYNRFANALLQCVKYPKNTPSAITTYHSSLNYYPVSINDLQKPNQTTGKIFGGGVILGIVLLLASIPAFILDPVFGAVALGLAFTCLFPSSLYFAAPDSKDTTHKKAEEKSLFEDAAKYVDPSLSFDEPKPSSYDYTDYSMALGSYGGFM